MSDSFSIYRTADDYSELNAGANRYAPDKLRAPALVWHLGFWTRTRNDEAGPWKIKNDVDTFIHTLGRALREQGYAPTISPCISGLCLLFHSVYEENTFDPVPGPVRLNQRQEDVIKSTDHAVTIEFKWEGLDVSIRFEIHTEYFSISTFVELEEGRVKAPFCNLDSLNSNIQEMLRYLRSRKRPPTKDINDYFFAGFWDEYIASILSDASVKALVKKELFKNVFADLRGVILSEQAKKFKYDGDLSNRKKPLRWGQQAKERLLPLIRVHNDDRNEYTVNYLLDGRAMYLSSLGGAPPPFVKVKERVPVQFIVYAHQLAPHNKTIVNERQLGRLVNQFLVLGTHRLAATKHVRHLHRVGRILRLLEKNTHKARDAVAKFKSDEQAIDLIQKAHRHFNSVAGGFLNVTGSGLLFRIERSRYYVTRFKADLELLRIDRLEGDQPYNDFVARRLGAEFDYIDRLGTRYERAVNNIVALDQNYLAMRSNDIQNKIQKIQELGDLALIGALLPYYVMHLLDLVVDERFIPQLTFVVWGGLGCLAICRKYINRESTAGSIMRTVIPIVVALLISLILLELPKEQTFVPQLTLGGVTAFLVYLLCRRFIKRNDAVGHLTRILIPSTALLLVSGVLLELPRAELALRRGVMSFMRLPGDHDEKSKTQEELKELKTLKSQELAALKQLLESQNKLLEAWKGGLQKSDLLPAKP